MQELATTEISNVVFDNVDIDALGTRTLDALADRGVPSQVTARPNDRRDPLVRHERHRRHRREPTIRVGGKDTDRRTERGEPTPTPRAAARDRQRSRRDPGKVSRIAAVGSRMLPGQVRGARFRCSGPLCRRRPGPSARADGRGGQCGAQAHRARNPPEHDDHALGLDPLEAHIRQVYFFDTPDLALDTAGVVVRPDGSRTDDGDSVVKPAPVVPDTIPRDVRRAAAFSIEVDAIPGGFVCSGSFKGQRQHARSRGRDRQPSDQVACSPKGNEPSPGHKHPRDPTSTISTRWDLSTY